MLVRVHDWPCGDGWWYIYMYIYMWLWQATNLARRKSIYKWAKKKKKASNPKALKEQLYIALAFCTQRSPTAVTGEKERCGQGSAELGRSFLAAPSDKVSLLYCETTPWCLLCAAESRRAFYHLALGNGLINDRLVKHHYCRGSERDASIIVEKRVFVLAMFIVS